MTFCLISSQCLTHSTMIAITAAIAAAINKYGASAAVCAATSPHSVVVSAASIAALTPVTADWIAIAVVNTPMTTAIAVMIGCISWSFATISGTLFDTFSMISVTFGIASVTIGCMISCLRVLPSPSSELPTSSYLVLATSSILPLVSLKLSPTDEML